METTYTFCDNCNLERNASKTMVLSQSTCRILGVPPETYAIRGAFMGTFQEAQELEGWKEHDFGHCCPTCDAELGLVSGVDSVVGVDALAEGIAKVLDEEPSP